MENTEALFIFSFVVALTGLVWLVGAAITGFVTQSMYCDEGACFELCRSDADCRGEAGQCCLEGEVAVCKAAGDCAAPYAFEPRADVDLSEVDVRISVGDSPRTERPAPAGRAALYASLILLVFALGLMYVGKIRSGRAL